MPSLGLNAAFSLVTNLTGVRLDPYQGFNFMVEIEGILAGGFSECTGLAVQTEFEDYKEGGVNDFVHRFAGRTTYPPLVLKHGLTQIDGLYVWHQEVAQGIVTRRNGTIYLLDKDKLPAAWWDFKDAFPYRYTGPELRADSASVAFESVELAHRGLSRPTVTGLLGGLAAGIAGALDVSLGF